MLELNRIYNMDCLEGMKQIDDESIDLIVTDPPYLINYKTGRRQDKDHKFCSVIQNDDNPELISNYIKECYRIMKNNTAMYMFCNSDKVDFFKQELEKYFTIKNLIIWVKDNHTAGDLEAQFGKQYEMIFLVNKGRKLFNGERITDVWQYRRVSSENQLHQNQKPLTIIKRAIEKHSNKGNIIFDGFMGSATTAIACIDLKRNYIGFEIDKQEFDTAQKRIADRLSQPTFFDELIPEPPKVQLSLDDLTKT